jgi:hypothetical protein
MAIVLIGALYFASRHREPWSDVNHHLAARQVSVSFISFVALLFWVWLGVAVSQVVSLGIYEIAEYGWGPVPVELIAAQYSAALFYLVCGLVISQITTNRIVLFVSAIAIYVAVAAGVSSSAYAPLWPTTDGLLDQWSTINSSGFILLIGWQIGFSAILLWAVTTRALPRKVSGLGAVVVLIPLAVIVQAFFPGHQRVTPVTFEYECVTEGAATVCSHPASRKVTAALTPGFVRLAETTQGSDVELTHFLESCLGNECPEKDGYTNYTVNGLNYSSYTLEYLMYNQYTDCLGETEGLSDLITYGLLSQGVPVGGVPTDYHHVRDAMSQMDNSQWHAWWKEHASDWQTCSLQEQDLPQ